MKKETYIYFDSEGNLSTISGSWAKRDTEMDMDAVCSEILETEALVYHYQPEHREAALDYIRTRPKLEDNRVQK
jgi:hypothetical protein